MILSSMPRPAWLSADAPYGDVVLSSRVRIMRNLVGYRFPHAATDAEISATMDAILAAAKSLDLGLSATKDLTQAERDYLVGCRLVSPDFEWTRPGRALLTDGSGSLSLMVNEEDHLRIQALTAGWSIDHATARAELCLDRLSGALKFAWSPRFGFLSASPFNAGEGRRLSVMFHLIGLAHSKRLPSVLTALTAKGIATRGLFGESSRAIGAFVQVSYLGPDRSSFVGACDYLIQTEREARSAVGLDTLREKASQALSFAVASRAMSLADSLRVLGWIRWAASAGLPALDLGARDVDALLTSMDPTVDSADGSDSRNRASLLRTALESQQARLRS